MQKLHEPHTPLRLFHPAHFSTASWLHSTVYPGFECVSSLFLSLQAFSFLSLQAFSFYLTTTRWLYEFVMPLVVPLSLLNASIYLLVDVQDIPIEPFVSEKFLNFPQKDSHDEYYCLPTYLDRKRRNQIPIRSPIQLSLLNT